MSLQNYAITIKCIKSGYFADEQELHEVLCLCVVRHVGIICAYEYERDSLGRLHLHGHFMARKGIRLNLYKKPFYTVHIDPLKSIDDVQNWCNYMRKDHFNDWLQELRNGKYLFQESLIEN